MYGDHRYLHVLTHSFPTRRSSERPTETHWQVPVRMPSNGVVTEAAIPGNVSGFDARPATLYLPPAYLADPRAELPVLVLVAGEPGSPSDWRSEEHTYELQSLMRISYAVFCLNTKTIKTE